MKKKFSFIVGLFALSQAIFKVVTCLSCDDSIFGFKIPGLLYVLFWTFLSIVILYDVYKVNWANKQK